MICHSSHKKNPWAVRLRGNKGVTWFGVIWNQEKGNMKRENKKVREIQQSLDNIAALKAEAKYISSFIYKKPKQKQQDSHRRHRRRPSQLAPSPPPLHHRRPRHGIRLLSTAWSQIRPQSLLLRPPQPLAKRRQWKLQRPPAPLFPQKIRYLQPLAIRYWPHRRTNQYYSAKVPRLQNPKRGFFRRSQGVLHFELDTAFSNFSIHP